MTLEKFSNTVMSEGVTEMEKFEYKVITTESVKAIVEIRRGERLEEAVQRFEDWLNSHGAEGWEFVCKGAQSYCFKRVKK